MTVFLHELKQNRLSLIIWTAVIAYMLGICIVIYPEMKSQMNEMSDMFANMGSFSEAFGMDSLNFGEFMGYFAIECGNVLGMGGAFFAAILGVSALAKEERDGTGEFLLTHPITRRRVITEKLAFVMTSIVLLNVVVASVTCLCIVAIGEEVAAKTIFLLFLSYLLLQIELAAVTFGISAFVTRGAMGIGIGLAATTYFLNIIANLSDSVKFLKYFTPFAYADGSYIVNNHALPIKYLAVGVAFALCGIVLAYLKYEKKDIL